MSKRYLIATIVLGLILSLYGSGAESTDAPAKPTGLESPKESTLLRETTITYEWKNGTPLREVLMFIAEKAKVTLIPDINIDDSVTISRLSVNNLNWHDVLNEALRLSGCIAEEIKPNYFRIRKPPLIEMEMIEDTPIEKVITQIAAMAGVSIIIADNVQGKVKFSFKNVPWMDALDYICKTSGFTVVKESHDVYRVIRPDAMAAQLETRIFQLKYLRPPSDYRAKIDTSYAVGAAKAPDAAKEFTLLDILQNMLSKNGMLKFDAKTNCIIAKDTKPALDEMQKVVEQLDVEPLQIMFLVNFVNTTNEDLLKFGVDYTSGGETEGWKITSIPSFRRSGTTNNEPNNNVQNRLTGQPFGLGGDISPDGTAANPPAFRTGFLSSFDVTATLRLFAKDVQSKLEQRPFILTLDGKEATIWVGERIHYAQVTVTAATGSTTTQSSISEATKSPAEQGFQLLVIPNVIKGTNKIMLTIIPENKVLTGKTSPAIQGFERFSSGDQSIDLPRYQQSTLVTNLIAEDGQTAVIGGLSTENTSKTVTKVPILGDIPIIGDFLFKSTSDSVIKSYLLVYLTPRIIKESGASKEIYKEELKKSEEISKEMTKEENKGKDSKKTGK